jgi:hypothetical protein
MQGGGRIAGIHGPLIDLVLQQGYGWTSWAANRVGTGWGVAANFSKAAPSAAELSAIAAAFQTLRVDLSWSSIEPAGKCGKYDFVAADKVIFPASALGVRPYLTLTGMSPCYWDNSTGCSGTACLSGWTNFTNAAINRYRNKGWPFECPGEPDGIARSLPVPLFTSLCKLAGIEGNATFRKELLFGPAVTASTAAGMAFLNATLQQRLLDAPLSGGVSLQLVRSCASPPEAPAGELPAAAALVEQYAARYAVGAPPLVNRGWGYPSAGGAGSGCDPVTQGKYLARSWLVSTLLGVRLSLWSDWADDAAAGLFNGVAVVSSNVSAPLALKPAYLAALAAQTSVGSASVFAGRVDPVNSTGGVPPSDLFVLQFAAPAGPAFAVWSNATATCAVPAGSRRQCPRLVGAALPASPAACLAAGCCYDDGSIVGAGSLPCYEGLPPAAVTFPSGPTPPSASPAGFCWQVTDAFGFARGTLCSAAGTLTVNVTDGPVYLTPVPAPLLDTIPLLALPGQALMVTGTSLGGTRLLLCRADHGSVCGVPDPGAFQPPSASPPPPLTPLHGPPVPRLWLPVARGCPPCKTGQPRSRRRCLPLWRRTPGGLWRSAATAARPATACPSTCRPWGGRPSTGPPSRAMRTQVRQ